MAWTEANLKIFAAGLAIGGKWNHTDGTLPRVKSTLPSGSYGNVFSFVLSCDVIAATIMYSMDGGTPTTVYNGSTITVDQEGTFVCYAYAIYGQGLSPMSKFIYTLKLPSFSTSDVITLRAVSDNELSVAFLDDTLIPCADSISVYALSDDVQLTIS